MVTRRLRADEEAAGDLRVGQPAGHESNHFHLTLAEELEVLRTGPPLHPQFAEERGGLIGIRHRTEPIECGEGGTSLGDRDGSVTLDQRAGQLHPRAARLQGHGGFTEGTGGLAQD